MYSPILNDGSWVSAAAHAHHDHGEQEEEAGHGEAHAVHRLEAHDGVTVHLVLDARYAAPALAETGDLEATQSHRRRSVTGEII